MVSRYVCRAKWGRVPLLRDPSVRRGVLLDPVHGLDLGGRQRAESRGAKLLGTGTQQQGGCHQCHGDEAGPAAQGRDRHRRSLESSDQSGSGQQGHQRQDGHQPALPVHPLARDREQEGDDLDRDQSLRQPATKQRRHGTDDRQQVDRPGEDRGQCRRQVPSQVAELAQPVVSEVALLLVGLDPEGGPGAGEVQDEDRAC